MGWWTEKAGSKSGSSRKPAKGKIDRKDKCGLCGKATCRCTRTDLKQGKEKVVIQDKNGRSRTVTRNEPFKKDSRGFDWCNRCSSRVINGRCTNFLCGVGK